MKTIICSNPICFAHGIPQPITEFHRDRGKKDGYCHTCKTCRKAAAATEDFRKQARVRQARYYNTERGKERKRVYDKTANTKLRDGAFNAYGGYVCVCCGETDFRFLTLDHIDGSGTKHRKVTGGGTAFYNWLKKNKYPCGFQVLCYNCNCGKHRNNGLCPHKDPR